MFAQCGGEHLWSQCSGGRGRWSSRPVRSTWWIPRQAPKPHRETLTWCAGGEKKINSKNHWKEKESSSDSRARIYPSSPDMRRPLSSLHTHPSQCLTDTYHVFPWDQSQLHSPANIFFKNIFKNWFIILYMSGLPTCMYILIYMYMFICMHVLIEAEEGT